MNDLYTVLNISPQADSEEIKQAYRKLVKQFHPDSQQATADHEKIVQINAAYEILGDPEKRSLYDKSRQPLYQKRESRREAAQREYKNTRYQNKNEQTELTQWQKVVYGPIEKTINQILRALPKQIDDLAADPFDDQLMHEFQQYLSSAKSALIKAKTLFYSRPNPAKIAKAAATLYYCLNQVADGLEELERFTSSYDDSALHQGQEFFRLAKHFIQETQQHLQYVNS